VAGQFVVNPTHEQQYESDLDLIYVGNERDMMMIEGSADQLPEADFVEALAFAHRAIQPIIAAQRKLAALCAKTKRQFPLVVCEARALAICERVAAEGDRLQKAIFLASKKERGDAVKAVIEKAKEACKAELGDAFDARQIKMAFEKLQEKVYRHAIIESGKRADGRGTKDLRPISCEVDVLPRVHGSAVFQRGETQGLVLATLGTSKDAQELDSITGGPKSKSFLLHYNFPPFSVGETGRFGMTSRRETGHGNLAERSLLSILPSEQDFPYSIRLVSEIMESNGSTSMASVCGGTLALLDAGVPIKAPVAGISCGLVTEEKDGRVVRHKVLTDIIGAEDHYGDMDFKICGTREGITGFQLDLKIHGLPFEIAKEAIAQNKVTRDAILDTMAKTMPSTRAELKPCAPRTHRIKIPSDKIGALIGPGGKNIKRITEYTGCQLDIDQDDSGWVTIFATDGESLARAVNEVNLISAQIEINKTYKGIVRSVKEFGCFVECLPGQEGLVHVSELADQRVERVEDVVKLGDEIIVKCVGIDDKGRVRLSRRAAIAEKEGREYTPAPKPMDRPRGDRPDRGERRPFRERGGDA
jgi:polyribonucleotide nucleotidyltransferase